MTGSIRIFQKLKFFSQSQGQTSNVTVWHILLGLLLRFVVMSMSLQNIECDTVPVFIYLRYSASVHLQNFAADSTLSASPKITATQNCHSIAKQQSKTSSNYTLDSSFVSYFSKISSVQPSQKIIKQILIYN